LTNKYIYKWTKSDITIDALALRTETTDHVLSNPNGEVQEDDVEKVTSEVYALGGEYTHNLSRALLLVRECRLVPQSSLRHRESREEAASGSATGSSRPIDNLVGEVGGATRTRSRPAAAGA
jgi:hypothetical protein